MAPVFCYGHPLILFKDSFLYELSLQLMSSIYIALYVSLRQDLVRFCIQDPRGAHGVLGILKFWNHRAALKIWGYQLDKKK